MVAMEEVELPIDEVEMGTAGLAFEDIMELRRQDAKQQEHLVDLCAQVLEQSCLINDAKQSGGFPKHPTVFHGQRPPNITPRQYIERIATYSGCSPCCIVLGMKYLENLRGKDPAYELTSLNFHRLTLTAVLIAAKFVDDFYYSNGYWAKVGGVQVGELNGMETEFLFLTSFNLHVKRAEYDQFVAELFLRLEDPVRRMGSLNIGASPTSAVLWDGFTPNPPSLAPLGTAVYAKQPASTPGVWKDMNGNQMHRGAEQGPAPPRGGQGAMVPIHHSHQGGGMGMHQQQGVAPVSVPASRAPPPPQPLSAPPGVGRMGVVQPRPMGGGQPQMPLQRTRSNPAILTPAPPLQKAASMPLPNGMMPHSSYTGLALEC